SICSCQSTSASRNVSDMASSLSAFVTLLFKASAIATYGKKDMAVAEKNILAMDQTVANLHKVEVPASWANPVVTAETNATTEKPAYVQNILEPVNRLEGDNLTVGNSSPAILYILGIIKSKPWLAVYVLVSAPA
uniref:hypothetical protein n=1 Tax=Listeria monocytogenes TaxID=1639 RepID=UPI003F8B78DC